MGLPRLILIAIIIGGGIWLWRRLSSRPLSSKHPAQTQSMVRCANCHVHLPQDRAVFKQPHWYCNSEHLQQGPKTRD